VKSTDQKEGHVGKKQLVVGIEARTWQKVSVTDDIHCSACGIHIDCKGSTVWKTEVVPCRHCGRQFQTVEKDP